MTTINNQANSNLTKKTVRIKQDTKTFLETGKASIIKKGELFTKFTTRNKNTKQINYKVHYLLHDPFLYLHAYAKVSKNDGGDNESTLECFGLKDAEDIAHLMKTNQYEPQPARRGRILKLEKKTTQPLETSSQRDKIVQEALRRILEAVFEPEFLEHDMKTERYASNYGFRPKISTWDAVDMIQKKAQTCTVAIQGGIGGAYTKVNQTLVLKLIEKRIPDKKFLELINKFLKAGYISDKKVEYTLSGSPQGSILSPLFFNIYMFEMDKWIYNQYIEPFKEKIPLKRIIHPFQKNLSFNISRRRRTLKNLQLLKYSEKKQIKQTLHELKLLTKRRREVPKVDIEKKKINTFFYARYADEWVLLTTTSILRAEEIKQEITQYIKTNLLMDLEKDKTKITRTIDRFNFLGFNIGISPADKLLLVLQKTEKTQVRTKMRTLSRRFSVIPEKERILKKMALNGYICHLGNDLYNPIAKRAWALFTEYEIVFKFSQIIRGISRYYSKCTNTRSIQHISMLLWTSCLRTLCHKTKKSKSEILQKYGNEFTIANPYNRSNSPKTTKFVHHYKLMNEKL